MKGLAFAVAVAAAVLLLCAAASGREVIVCNLAQAGSGGSPLLIQVSNATMMATSPSVGFKNCAAFTTEVPVFASSMPVNILNGTTGMSIVNVTLTARFKEVAAFLIIPSSATDPSDTTLNLHYTGYDAAEPDQVKIIVYNGSPSSDAGGKVVLTQGGSSNDLSYNSGFSASVSGSIGLSLTYSFASGDGTAIGSVTASTKGKATYAMAVTNNGVRELLTVDSSGSSPTTGGTSAAFGVAPSSFFAASAAVVAALFALLL